MGLKCEWVVGASPGLSAGATMGGGNGMKSKTKRERQGSKKPEAKGASSQLTKNKQAMNIVCQMCRQVRVCRWGGGGYNVGTW